MVTLEAQRTHLFSGSAQYNKGDKIAVSEEEALKILEQFPDGWRECRREDAETKAPHEPPKNKQVKAPEHKK